MSMTTDLDRIASQYRNRAGVADPVPEGFRAAAEPEPEPEPKAKRSKKTKAEDPAE